MRKFRTLSLLALSILFIAVSCTKEGPEGPVGATGLQGPPGIQGPIGPIGPQGPQGTTNVTYSAWFVTGVGWTATGAPAYAAEFIYDKAAPGVTQAIIDQGIILGFMRGDPNLPAAQLTQTFPMPNSIGHGAGFIDTYDFVLNAVGNIRYLYKTTLPFFDATDLATISFRYVLIPGSVAGGRGNSGITTYAGYSADELKGMSYSQVAALFNIPAEGSNIR